MAKPEYMQCHVCHGKMLPCDKAQSFTRQDPVSKVITTKSIVVSCYICPVCGEIVYTSEEAKRIEDILTGRYADSV